MNSIIILPTECVDLHVARLVGARARYACETHAIREGQVLKAACWGGLRGEARVITVSPELVELELSLSLPHLDVFPADLIIGLSRPQTVRKVIQAGVMLGVRSIHFVRSERGEKSYAHSSALEEGALQDEILKALEQVWDSRAPTVRVHRNFSYFVKHHLPDLLGPDLLGAEGDRAKALLAHPGSAPLSAATLSAPVGPLDRFVIAIGSERGWDDCEVAKFQEQGFAMVGLGPRVLRVELAVTFLMGRLSALFP